jgi:amidase
MIARAAPTTFLVFTAGIAAALVGAARMSPTFQLQGGTIADIHRAFDTGGLTRQELVKLYLNRIAAYEDGGPKLNSITTVNPRVLSDAARSTQSRGDIVVAHLRVPTAIARRPFRVEPRRPSNHAATELHRS